MKPSPIVAAVLQEDVDQAPGWFWPAMLCLLLWAAGGISQAAGEHAALRASAHSVGDSHGK